MLLMNNHKQYQWQFRIWFWPESAWIYFLLNITKNNCNKINKNIKHIIGLWLVPLELSFKQLGMHQQMQCHTCCLHFWQCWCNLQKHQGSQILGTFSIFFKQCFSHGLWQCITKVVILFAKFIFKWLNFRQYDDK